jgi:hypothetical protein
MNHHNPLLHSSSQTDPWPDPLNKGSPNPVPNCQQNFHQDTPHLSFIPGRISEPLFKTENHPTSRPSINQVPFSTPNEPQPKTQFTRRTFSDDRRTTID